MSVAFRREGDEEHLEPKFEIPIPVGPNLVTRRGLALIAERVAVHEAAVAALADAPTDDPGRIAAGRDLRYWQTRQVTAELIATPSGETVEIGTCVTFRLNGKERSVAIVGHDEADPAGGSIAFAAPLARAMIGAEPGDHVPFGGREDGIEVLSVRVLD